MGVIKTESSKQMIAKYCVITGATSGIGEATAGELAEMGANLAMVGRSEEKCMRTFRRLTTAGGNHNIEYFVADLSLRSDICRLAEAFKARYNDQKPPQSSKPSYDEEAAKRLWDVSLEMSGLTESS